MRKRPSAARRAWHTRRTFDRYDRQLAECHRLIESLRQQLAADRLAVKQIETSLEKQIAELRTRKSRIVIPIDVE